MSFEEIISDQRLILVDFFATWCGPCMAMMPMLDTLQQEWGDTVLIVKIDVDQYLDTAVERKVMGVPTLALFKNGEELWRQPGVMTAQALKDTILKFQ